MDSSQLVALEQEWCVEKMSVCSGAVYSCICGRRVEVPSSWARCMVVLVLPFQIDQLRHDDDATLSTETDNVSSLLLHPSLPPPSSTSVSAPSISSLKTRTSGTHQHGLKCNIRGGTLTVRPNLHLDIDGGSGKHHYSYAYAYRPAGLMGLRANIYMLHCAVFTLVGGLTFGYDQGIIVNMLVMENFVMRWPIGPWERGLMSMSSPLAIPLVREI